MLNTATTWLFPIDFRLWVITGTALACAFHSLVMNYVHSVLSVTLSPKDPEPCEGDNITFTCILDDPEGGTILFSINNDLISEEDILRISDTEASFTMYNLSMDNYNDNICCCKDNCTTNNLEQKDVTLLRVHSKLLLFYFF